MNTFHPHPAFQYEILREKGVENETPIWKDVQFNRVRVGIRSSTFHQEFGTVDIEISVLKRSETSNEIEFAFLFTNVEIANPIGELLILEAGNEILDDTSVVVTKIELINNENGPKSTTLEFAWIVKKDTSGGLSTEGFTRILNSSDFEGVSADFKYNWSFFLTNFQRYSKERINPFENIWNYKQL